MRPCEPDDEREFRTRLGLDPTPLYEEHTGRGAPPARDALEALERTPRLSVRRAEGG